MEFKEAKSIGFAFRTLTYSLRLVKAYDCASINNRRENGIIIYLKKFLLRIRTEEVSDDFQNTSLHLNGRLRGLIALGYICNNCYVVTL